MPGIGNWRVAESALLVAPFIEGNKAGAWTNGDIAFIIHQRFVRVADWIQVLVHETDRKLYQQGEIATPRYALERICRVGAGVEIEVGLTDWATVSSLQSRVFNSHRLHCPEGSEAPHGAWAISQEAILTTGRPDGFPHHIAVHPLVLCSDGFVVTCARSNVSHQPGRLSLSIEEQMQPAHLSASVPVQSSPGLDVRRVNGDEGPISAVVRGVKEELGVSISVDQVEVLGVALERTSVAVNILSLVRLEQTLAQVRVAWRSAEGRNENTLLGYNRSVALSDFENPGRWERRSGPHVNRWHSSSRLRLLLALWRTRGVESVRPAFSEAEIAHVIDRSSRIFR